MKRLFTLLYIACASLYITAQQIIPIAPTSEICNGAFIAALQQAAACHGKPVVIQLQPGVYRLDRSQAVEKPVYVSNTTSETEAPDITKHFGLFLQNLRNVTIDGRGATLLLNGEMSTMALLQCNNIVLKNLNIDHAAPTQTEMTVVEDGKDYLIAKVHPTSGYMLDNGTLYWLGDGWKFNEGIAQWYDYITDTTWREWSPMNNLQKTVELRPNLLYLQYNNNAKPTVPVGTTFQMRDAIRDEVCAVINQSKDIVFENVNFHYLGNFGVVFQCSENLTVEHCNFEPRPGSLRTNAGFADFIQVSGSKGLVTIDNCRFAGAHDDPINIHGTHLKLTQSPAPDKVIVRFMHHQTYGFEAFFKGDRIELVNERTLLPVATNKVKAARMLSPREMELTLATPLTQELMQRKDIVIENVTWTPDVRITNNYFTRIPTRGILLSTRGKSLIEGNTFHAMPMPGILVADDAMSWYESGPVHDLTIRQNTFYNCAAPVIRIHPETHEDAKPVHRNITIERNSFYMKDGATMVVQAKSVDGLAVQNNLVVFPTNQPDNFNSCIETNGCQRVRIDNNRVQTAGF